ncbi:hypothetical protein [Rhizobium leguminosarum]|uniref:hypothetical protein n=1 Tax=Rhizobium leguminosarum TaxID=384 RepID=UPI001C96DEA6|nr:hypothetical protein [Rhizobium leguminosarum]
MLIIHDDILLLLPEHVLMPGPVAAHHYKDDRLIRKSTVPTENFRPALWSARRPDRQAKQTKIVRSEMRIIEPANDQHRALPRERRP